MAQTGRRRGRPPGAAGGAGARAAGAFDGDLDASEGPVPGTPNCEFLAPSKECVNYCIFHFFSLPWGHDSYKMKGNFGN